MILTVNGEKSTVWEKISVSELLTRFKVESPDLVSVQINGTFLAKEEYSTTRLAESDEVDFLYFLGGGR